MYYKPTYNPQIHHRRSIRLKGYDYSRAGLYFITICCENRKYRFGKIENEKMILNEYGTIAYNEWIKLTERFSNFELDVFQIMPNHMHAIIALNTVGAGFIPVHNNVEKHHKIYGQSPNGQPNGLPIHLTDNDNWATARIAPTIGDIIGAYKSLVANECLKIWKTKWVGANQAPIMGKLWQTNYYEHIIRNQQSYQNISEYIVNNPAKWQKDKFYK
jgi:REP element-mobilizing transposase RayT